MIDDRVSRFNFGGASPLIIAVFVGVIVIVVGYICFRIIKNYYYERKRFGWIYDLASQLDLTRTEIQDLKETALENDIVNVDQLYRILHSVKMMPSTRKKLYFGTKESDSKAKKTVKPAR